MVLVATGGVDHNEVVEWAQAQFKIAPKLAFVKCHFKAKLTGLSVKQPFRLATFENISKNTRFSENTLERKQSKIRKNEIKFKNDKNWSLKNLP